VLSAPGLRLPSLARRLLRLRASGGHTSVTTKRACVRPAGPDYYGGVIIGAETIGARALEPDLLDKARTVLEQLQADDYLEYLHAFVDKGREVAHDAWRYADVVTVLAAATELIEPEAYLEIGVRQGRSMAVVGAGAPTCAILGIDMWVPQYAGIANPGPQLVRRQLERVGFRGDLELLSGNSHDLLPRLWEEDSELTFDLITVDGDHTPRGASRDLRDVLPRLRIGGAVIFDDIAHPLHRHLRDVWHRRISLDSRYSSWEFDDLGYGVAVAVRRW
jgi:predicted O-methyltransferase YrrM